jgi:hypothetical protein
MITLNLGSLENSVIEAPGFVFGILQGMLATEAYSRSRVVTTYHATGLVTKGIGRLAILQGEISVTRTE